MKNNIVVTPPTGNLHENDKAHINKEIERENGRMRDERTKESDWERKERWQNVNER